jgi:GNAT superfamily N-acetyltransferase
MVMVRPEYQGKGIAKGLISLVREKARLPVWMLQVLR